MRNCASLHILQCNTIRVIASNKKLDRWVPDSSASRMIRDDTDMFVATEDTD